MPAWYFMNFTRRELAHASLIDVLRQLVVLMRRYMWRESDKVDLTQLSQYDVDELIRKGGWRLIGSGGIGGGRHDPINPIIYPPPFDDVGR
jgi:hypothetical protein